MCHPRCAKRRRQVGRKLTTNRAQVRSVPAADDEVLPTRMERDPTQQKTRRNKARRDIKARVKKAREPILKLIEGIPNRRVQEQTVNHENGIITVNRTRYEYLIDASRMADIDNAIRDIINDLLQVNSRNKPQRWFFDAYVQESYQTGTAQSAGRIDAMAQGAGVQVPEAAIERVLQSAPYRRRLELVLGRAFEDMKGFAEDAAEDLGRILFEGVARGESPRGIARAISGKFSEVEGYRAERIARTEVNNAFTNARLENTVDMRDRLGIEVRLMHVSALVAGTRSSHAARHGNVYTPEEVQDWKSEGANSINCLCSWVEVLYRNGQPVQGDLIERQKKRGQNYFKRAG